MYIILLVCVLLVSSRAQAELVITAHDQITEELGDSSSVRGLFDFDVEGFLKKNGYPFENHEVTTEDGYILAIHRIPYGRNSSVSKFDGETKPTVLIMHGTGSSSVDFMVLGPERSLAMILADQGYDVWLGNNRGNTWSRNHETLDPDNSSAFWDFSFHELGIYDTSSVIDYILNTTGNEKVSYIGHSQGTTQFFVLAAQNPEYNNKINIMMALGPAVYCDNLTNPVVQILKNFYVAFELVTNLLNVTEVLGHSLAIETALKLVCKDGSAYQEVCTLVFSLVFGFDSEQFNRSDINTILGVFPAGLSIKELKHYLQLVESGYFRQFDYGIINNLKKYNQSAPPDYNISLVTAPVVLYYGQNDWLVGMADVDRLADELPNLVEKHLIGYQYFNHMDFIIAKDIVSLLYFTLVNKLNEANGLDSFTTPTTVSPTGLTSSNTTNKPTDSTDSNNVTTTTDISETTTTGSAPSLNSFMHTACTCIFMVILRFLI